MTTMQDVQADHEDGTCRVCGALTLDDYCEEHR